MSPLGVLNTATRGGISATVWGDGAGVIALLRTSATSRGESPGLFHAGSQWSASREVGGVSGALTSLPRTLR